MNQFYKSILVNLSRDTIIRGTKDIRKRFLLRLNQNQEGNQVY